MLVPGRSNVSVARDGSRLPFGSFSRSSFVVLKSPFKVPLNSPPIPLKSCQNRTGAPQKRAQAQEKGHPEVWSSCQSACRAAQSGCGTCLALGGPQTLSTTDAADNGWDGCWACCCVHCTHEVGKMTPEGSGFNGFWAETKAMCRCPFLSPLPPCLVCLFNPPDHPSLSALRMYCTV